MKSRIPAPPQATWASAQGVTDPPQSNHTPTPLGTQGFLSAPRPQNTSTARVSQMRPPLVPPFLHVLPGVYLARHMLSTTKTKESRPSPSPGGARRPGSRPPPGPAWAGAPLLLQLEVASSSVLLPRTALCHVWPPVWPMPAPLPGLSLPIPPLGTFSVWPGHRIPQSRVLSQTRSLCPPRNREIEPSPVSEGKPSRACSSTQIKCLPLPRACGALPSAPVSHFLASLPRPAPASFPASTPPAPPTSVLWACKKFSLQIVRKLCLPAPHHSDKSWTVPSS